MSARRAMNVAYAMLSENMPLDERKSFQASLDMSVLDWNVYQQAELAKERRRRADVVKGVGEVG